MEERSTVVLKRLGHTAKGYRVSERFEERDKGMTLFIWILSLVGVVVTTLMLAGKLAAVNFCIRIGHTKAIIAALVIMIIISQVIFWFFL